MKILLISDLHLGFFKNPLNIVKRINQFKVRNGIDITLSMGDLSQGTWFWDREEPWVKAFLNDPNLYYVLGNHDLWEERCWDRPLEEPPVNFHKMVDLIASCPANPLEQSMREDYSAFYRIGDTLILGSMGFPDFQHPLYIDGKSWYDKNVVTNDGFHMNLQKGWLHFSTPMMDAFEKRIRNALDASEGVKTVLVCSHYPFLEGQSVLKCDEVADPYYFNFRMGEIIMEYAQKHPDKQFFCFCGHSHSHCRGELNQLEDNLHVLGVRTDYNKLTMKMIEIVDGQVVKNKRN